MCSSKKKITKYKKKKHINIKLYKDIENVEDV